MDESHKHASITGGAHDKTKMLASISLTSTPSAAPLEALATLLATESGPWPVFDLLNCYTRLWKHLPEEDKAGTSAQHAQLLGQISRQIKDSYSGMISLFPESNTAAIHDTASSGSLNHQELSSFVQNFSLPVTKSENSRPVIALALPNGPLIGLAILAVTSYYTAAPMAVGTGAEQFKSDILQSGAKTILALRSDVVKLGLQDAWVYENGIQVILLEPNSRMTFDMTYLDSSPVITSTRHKPNIPDDIALILFTSGTSGKKKVVPYTVHTMVAGIGFVIESWGLTKDDVCMNMMPLFHVGGIIRNLFAPIMAGGSTICCPAFDPNLFWDVVEDRQPTWYYASPSMHSVILDEAQNRPEALEKCKIRLICNAAGGLLPSLAITLRDTFNCIVLPSYGMTECMPIASPPLDYKLDRSGTSGMSVGPEISILDGNDRSMPVEEVGRIAVRGAPVFDGYLKEDNVIDTSCFTDAGWFDTGDMGYLDADGYLYVTGRSKEVINRGGELVSPFEVEEALVIASGREDSPLYGSISAALAFSMPHDVLQEVVGAVLVTPPGARRADIKMVHEAVRDSLAQPKWPVFIVYMDDLPKNNNKILRIKLAERLGLETITDETPLAHRHYEAICPPNNTALSVPIQGSPCSFDLDLVSRKLSEIVGSDVEVFVRKASHDSYPEAFLAPRKNSTWNSSVAELPQYDYHLRSNLDAYLIPSKLHCLDKELPRDRQGSVNDEELEAWVQGNQGGGEIAGNLSKTEATIAAVFVRILSCSAEGLTEESDFFQLGGDSLRAGRLLSELRKEFGLRLPINLLFVHSSIGALARNIDEMRGDVADQKGPAGTSAEQEPPVQRGCEKTYSSTNPFLMILQLVPIVLLYPMKRALTWTIFMYMLTATRDWVTAHSLTGRLFNLILSLGIGRLVSRCIFPFVGLALKWLIIGKYKEGLYPMWGSYHTRWWIVDKALTVCGRGHFGVTDTTLIWYYRLLGAKIGKGAKVNRAATIREFDLITIEDGANLDKCICRGFAAEQNTTMYLGAIRVGKDSSVGVGSIVAPGTEVPDSACIGPNSSSWETSEAASEENRDLSTGKVPGTHPILEWLIILPISLLVVFCRSGPWIAGLVGLVKIQPGESTDHVKTIIDWFAEPKRIGFHYLALVLNSYFGPMAWFVVAFILKKLLDITIGKLTPGPAHTRGNWQRFRMALLKKTVSGSQFHKLSEIFGAHYEFTSIMYRLMGAKVGERVYWPGTGPTVQDFDLIDVGNDVVFGSRSHMVTSDGTGSDFVKVGNNAMISDRVVLLPGATIGDRAVLGSGALTRRERYYPSDTVWVGSKAGEAICLSGQTSRSKRARSSMVVKEEIDEKKSLSRVSTRRVPEETANSSSTTLAGRDADRIDPVWSSQNSQNTTPAMSGRASFASGKDQEKNGAPDASESSSPFGRAFYEGKAPYRVFGLWTIFFYSSLITIFSAFYWNVATTSALQIVARIVNADHYYVNQEHAWRPLMIYCLFCASIAALQSAQAVLALGLVIGAKWVIMGRRHAGNYDWDKSSYCQRWQLYLACEKLRRHCYGGAGILGLLTGTHYAVMYFRSLGATIGKDCALFAGGLPSLMFTEPDLLTLGDRVSVDDASLVSHINSRGVFNLNPLSVGDRSVLRSGSRLLSGAAMGKDTVLLEHTLVMAGDVVEDGQVYQGWPGEQFMESRINLSQRGLMESEI